LASSGTALEPAFHAGDAHENNSAGSADARSIVFFIMDPPPGGLAVEEGSIRP